MWVGVVGARLFAAFDKSQAPSEALVENGGFEPVDDRLPDLARGDESRPAQQSQVVGHGRLAQGERGGQFAGGMVALAEQVEDVPARGIVQGAKKVVHPEHSMIRQLSK